MDPAETDTLQKAVTNQGTLLGQHHQMLEEFKTSQQSLGAQVTQVGRMVELISKRLQTTASSSSHASASASTTFAASAAGPRETPVPHPEPYHGDLGKSKGFLLQCLTVFTCQPLTFATDYSKIAFITGLLRGRALDWAEAILSSTGIAGVTYEKFISDFKNVFAHPNLEIMQLRGYWTSTKVARVWLITPFNFVFSLLNRGGMRLLKKGHFGVA